MRQRGDVLWQREAKRDFRHGWLFVAFPFLLLAALMTSPLAALALIGLAAAYLARTARRCCAWKAPGATGLMPAPGDPVAFPGIPALLGPVEVAPGAPPTG